MRSDKSLKTWMNRSTLVLILLWTGYALWQDIDTFINEVIEGLNPTLDWICALTVAMFAFSLACVPVLILLWTGYALWQSWNLEIKEEDDESLNPTLDWICALTASHLSLFRVWNSSLNPTLDWICALTNLNLKNKENRAKVLILLWTGYALWQSIKSWYKKNFLVLILLWTGYALWQQPL